MRHARQATPGRTEARCPILHVKYDHINTVGFTYGCKPTLVCLYVLRHLGTGTQTPMECGYMPGCQMGSKKHPILYA
jgi:hypothetical protein